MESVWITGGEQLARGPRSEDKVDDVHTGRCERAAAS